MENGRVFNNFCICGHAQSAHKDEEDGAITIQELGQYWCSGCTAQKVESRSHFHNFKSDNLRYLQERYEKRTKR